MNKIEKTKNQAREKKYVFFNPEVPKNNTTQQEITEKARKILQNPMKYTHKLVELKTNLRKKKYLFFLLYTCKRNLKHLFLNKNGFVET